MLHFLRIAFYSILYFALGAGFSWITDRYIDTLAEKVREVDYRFEKRLYFKIPIKSELQKNLYSVILMMVWPAVCIVSILKAEWEYDIIVHHAVNRMEP